MYFIFVSVAPTFNNNLRMMAGILVSSAHYCAPSTWNDAWRTVGSQETLIGGTGLILRDLIILHAVVITEASCPHHIL